MCKDVLHKYGQESLRVLRNDCIIHNVIGKGRNGMVCDASLKYDGRKVVVKFLSCARLRIEYEIAMQKRFATFGLAPSVIKCCFWTFRNKTCGAIVMEYIGEDLIHHLAQPHSQLHLQHLLKQLYNIFRRLKSYGLQHNDLWLGNVVISPETHRLYLIDFSTSKLQSSSLSHRIHRLEFIPLMYSIAMIANSNNRMFFRLHLTNRVKKWFHAKELEACLPKRSVKDVRQCFYQNLLKLTHSQSPDDVYIRNFLH